MDTAPNFLPKLQDQTFFHVNASFINIFILINETISNCLIKEQMMKVKNLSKLSIADSL